jgi:Zn-dependent protease with chaperone function
VSFAVTLCLVLLAGYGVSVLALSALVAVSWHTGLRRIVSKPDDMLAIRMVPVGGALLFALTVLLPAFLIYEPTHEAEEVGPLLPAFATIALVAVGVGARRAWRACAAARALLRRFGPAERLAGAAQRRVQIVDIAEPIVAVVGAWCPRIIAAKRVMATCSEEEFCTVVAHEAAHVTASDNLKLLLQIAAPDALAWLPTGSDILSRWRAAAEFEADDRATGLDRHKRVALASALVKVARLASASDPPIPILTMAVALDDFEGRVRHLLAPPSEIVRTRAVGWLVVCALLTPLAALPTYALVYQTIEALVAFGN